MDNSIIHLFVENLWGTCAFVDGTGNFLAVTPRFKKTFDLEVFSDGASDIMALMKLLGKDFHGREIHLETLSDMEEGLKDFADMTIRWREHSFFIQFTALRHENVFLGVLVNVIDVSERVLDDEHRRKVFNHLMQA